MGQSCSCGGKKDTHEQPAAAPASSAAVPAPAGSKAAQASASVANPPPPISPPPPPPPLPPQPANSQTLEKEGSPAPAKRSSVRKSVQLDSSSGARRPSIGGESSPMSVPSGPKKLTADEIMRFHENEELGSVSTSRPAIVSSAIAKPRPYAVKSFSAPLGHPDHDPLALVSEEKKNSANRYFDPANPHLAPPSALHRIATKWENHDTLTHIEVPVLGRPTALTDVDYQPSMSSASVQFHQGVVNPEQQVRTADGTVLSPGRGGPAIDDLKIKLGSSIQAQYEARHKRHEHPLRAMLRAHSEAPSHYKKGSKLLTPVTSLNFSARSGNGNTEVALTSTGGLESLSGTWPPSSPNTMTSSSSGYSGFAEVKAVGDEGDDRDRHRMPTHSSKHKRNCMVVTIPLGTSRNPGFK